MRFFEKLANQTNTENILLDKLVFLLEEETNITSDFLMWVIKYCEEHKIPIWKEEQFNTLVIESKRITQEIKHTSAELRCQCKKGFLSDDFLQGDSSDKDYTEPGVL